MSAATQERPSVLTPRPRVRLDYLDGLRGLAALTVVLFHVSGILTNPNDPRPLPAWLHGGKIIAFGHYAVDVFIVLSGFCLMMPVALAGTGRLTRGAGDFFRRRARRILPPYYAALALSILALALAPALRHDDGSILNWYHAPAMLGAVASHLLLLHNLRPDWVFRCNGSLWSVATEWQIYFLFPLLLLPLWRRFGPAAPIVVGFVLGLATLRFHLEDACFWYVGLFAMGMAGAGLAFSPPASASETRRTYLALAAALVLLAPLTVKAGVRGVHPVHDLLVGALTTLLLVFCARHCHRTDDAPRPFVLRVLSLPAVVSLGAFSYSLYLTHAPFLAIFEDVVFRHGAGRMAELTWTVAVGVPLALLFAYAFHLAFERRFMNAPPLRKEGPAPRGPVPVPPAGRGLRTRA